MKRRRTKACHNPVPLVSTESVTLITTHNEAYTEYKCLCSRCWTRPRGACFTVSEYRKSGLLGHHWTLQVCLACLTENERQLYQLQNLSNVSVLQNTVC